MGSVEHFGQFRTSKFSTASIFCEYVQLFFFVKNAAIIQKKRFDFFLISSVFYVLEMSFFHKRFVDVQ